MKVKELIKQLDKFDEDLIVFGFDSYAQTLYELQLGASLRDTDKERDTFVLIE